MKSIRFTMAAALALASVGWLAGGCSNGDNTATDSGTDTGGGGDGGGGNTFNQTGHIVDFTTKAGLAGVTVSDGTNSATSDSKGNYTLAVAKNTPYTMQISNTAYLTLDEQEWMLLGDANRGDTSAVSNTTESLLKSILQPQPQATLAVLSIQVQAMNPDAGACTSATGATISVPGLPDPDAGAGDGGSGSGPHLVYFQGGFPSAAATSVTDGELPSAIVYDLPVSASYSQVTVTPPAGCTVKAFPVADPKEPNIQYTGNVTLEARSPAAGENVASFMRVFIQ
jgi:hypothetical protein